MKPHPIIDLRKHVGWTQRELAAAAGLSDVYIKKIEQGRCKPSAKAAEKIIKALETKLLAGLDARQKEINEVISEIHNDIDYLSTRQPTQGDVNSFRIRFDCVDRALEAQKNIIDHTVNILGILKLVKQHSLW